MATANWMWPRPANDNTISMFLGKGNGTFAPHVSYGAGAGAYGLAAGDMNGDGKLDLVVTNTGVNTVSVLVGHGNGTLQAPENYATGSFRLP